MNFVNLYDLESIFVCFVFDIGVYVSFLLRLPSNHFI